MTFGEAKTKVGEIAGGAAYGVAYRNLIHSDGETEPTCEVWVMHFDMHSGSTWAKAIDGLQIQIDKTRLF